jgi:hypothetical protein
VNRVLSLIAFALFVSMSALAQFEGGSVVGTVTDSSGSVIPGATVEIRSSATGVARQAVTSASGEYNFVALQPGQYAVTTKQKGFKDSTQNIELAVGQRLQANFTLAVGSEAQSVTVNAAIQTLDTVSSEISNIRTPQQVVDLPLNGRNFTQLVLLAPGVNNKGASQNEEQAGYTTARGTNGGNINGNPAEDTVFLIDGIQSVDNDAGILVFFPPVDAIQEFEVQTSSAPAAYGGSPGIINVTFRSGTNSLHGVAYEFLRNSALDAKNYFDSATTPIPAFRMNQFGGNLGGPVVIPHIINGKDKFFFFADYEGKRESQAQTYVNTIPTAAFLRGNFQALEPAGGCPAVTAVKVTGCLYQPGTNNPIPGNQIPIGQIDPTAQNIVNQLYSLISPNYPTAATAGIVNNFVYNPAVVVDINQGDLRLDYKTAKTTMFGRFSKEDPLTISPGYLPPPLVGGGPSFPGTITVPSYQIALGYARSIGSNMYYEARLGFSRVYEDISETDTTRGNLAEQLGIPNANAGGATGLTNFSISGMTAGLGDASGSLSKVNNNWEVDQAFSWIKGNHEFKFGFDWMSRRFAEFSPTYPVGQFTFNGAYTNYGFADFLLGHPSSSTLGVTQFFSLQRFQPSFYVQDNYRMTPKLTLNFGIRNDLVTPWVERSNRLAGFVPENGGNLVPVGTAPYLGDSTVDGRYTNWGPRFGFAYSLDSKTVIRGGVGIFYAFEYSVSNLSKNAPFAGNYSTTNSTSSAAGFAAASPISAGFPAARPELFPVAGTNYIVYKSQYQNPSANEWSLNVQRQITRRDVLSAAYVAQTGVHVMVSLNTNLPPPGPGAIAPRRPYPNLGDATELCPCGNSSFQSLQVTYINHLSGGLNFQGVWTYAHSEDNTGGTGNQTPIQNPYNLESFRGNSDFDIRHNVVLSWTYDLPFGKGKRFAGDAHGALQTIIGGWQLNSIDTFQTGSPFTPVLAVSGLNNGTGTQWPDLIGPNRGKLSNPSVNEWFNVNAFVSPANNPAAGRGSPYLYGDSSRNQLFGPGTKQFDVSLFKNIALGSESRRLQLRAETFNIFNTPQFNNPDVSLGTAAAGTITSAGTPLIYERTSREIQLAGKLYF